MLQTQKSDPVFDPATALMEDMEPVLLDFIKANVTSFIKWDLITFFCKNRYIIGTVENLAQYAGRQVPVTEQALEELVGSKIMGKKVLDGLTTYSPGNDEKMWALISKFIVDCEDRDFRIKVVYHIVRGIR